MKKIFVLACVSLFVIVGLGVSTAAAQAQIKIGVVSVQRLLAESTASKAMEQKMQAAQQKMQTDLQAKSKVIEDLGKKFEKDAMVMSAEMRADKEREIRTKYNDFNALQQTYQQDLQSMQNRFLETMQKEILAVMEQIATKGNYTLILDGQTALYYQKVIDVTDEALKALNARNIKVN